MGDMKEYFEPYKQMHKDRVAKTPERLKYATELLEKNNVPYFIPEGQDVGQIICKLPNKRTIVFYAGTGKIQGYKNLRGIHNLIKLCKGQKCNDKIQIRKDTSQ